MLRVSLRLGLRDVPKTSRLSEVFIRVTQSSLPSSSIIDGFDEMDVDALMEECSKRSLSVEGVDENRLRRLLRTHDSSLEIEFGRTEVVPASMDMDFQALVGIDIDERLSNIPEIVVEVLGVLVQSKASLKANEQKAQTIDPTDCVSLGVWKGTPVDVQSVKAKKLPVKAHVLTEFIPTSESPFQKRRPRTDLVTPREGKAPLSQKTCVVMFCSLDDGFLAASSLLAKEIYDNPVKAKSFLPITTDILVTGMELTNFRSTDKGTPFLFVSFNKRRLWISKPARTALSSSTTHILPDISIPLGLFLDLDGESSSTAIGAREVSISDSLSSTSLTVTVGIWFEATDSNELHVADVGVSELHLIDLLLLTESTSLMLSLSKCREGDPAPKCKLRLRGQQKLLVPKETVQTNDTYSIPLSLYPNLQLSSPSRERKQLISSSSSLFPSQVTKPLLKRSQSFAPPSIPSLQAPSISPTRSLAKMTMSPSSATGTSSKPLNKPSSKPLNKPSSKPLNKPISSPVSDGSSVIPRTSVAKLLSLALEAQNTAPKDKQELEMDRITLMIDGLSTLALATSTHPASASLSAIKQTDEISPDGQCKPVVDVKQLYLQISNSESSTHNESTPTTTIQDTVSTASNEVTLNGTSIQSDTLNGTSIQSDSSEQVQVKQDFSTVIPETDLSIPSDLIVGDSKKEESVPILPLLSEVTIVVNDSVSEVATHGTIVEQLESVSAAESRTMQEALAILNNKDSSGDAEDELLFNSIIPVSNQPLWRPNCLQLEPPPIEAVVAASLSLGEEPALGLEFALKYHVLSELQRDIDLVKKCLESAASEADMGTYIPDRLAEILESVSVADIAIETQASIDSLSAVKVAHSSSHLILGGLNTLETSAGIDSVTQYAPSSIDAVSSLSSSSAAINEALKSDGASCIARVSTSVDTTRKVYASAITSACTRDAQLERDGKQEWFAHRKAHRIAASVSREIRETTRILLDELRSVRQYCSDSVIAYKEEVNSLRAELYDIASDIASREGLTLISDEAESNSTRHRVGTITLQALLKLCEEEPLEKLGGRNLRLEVAIVAAKKEVIDLHAIIGQDRSARQRENLKRESYELSTSQLLQSSNAQEDVYRLLDDPTPTKKERGYNVFTVEAERLQQQIDDLTLSITSIRRSISRAESLQQLRLAVAALWRIYEGNSASPISSSEMNRFYKRALEQAPYSSFSNEAFGLLRSKLEELNLRNAQQRVQPPSGNKWAREEGLAYYSNGALASRRNFEAAVNHNLAAVTRAFNQGRGKSEWEGYES